MGGVVAYSNTAKITLLKVAPQTLEDHGAVSAETVTQMALGAQELFKTHTAIAVSGIAGPSGGSPQKPLGTVWIGIALPSQVSAHHYRFFGNRQQIKQQSAEAALWLLAQNLALETKEPSQQRQLTTTQPIAVEFSDQGMDALRIRAFDWQGKRIVIQSIGRRWQDARGEHYLAMSYQGKVFELIRKADGCWYLRLPRESVDFA